MIWVRVVPRLHLSIISFKNSSNLLKIENSQNEYKKLSIFWKNRDFFPWNYRNILKRCTVRPVLEIQTICLWYLRFSFPSMVLMNESSSLNGFLLVFHVFGLFSYYMVAIRHVSRMEFILICTNVKNLQKLFWIFSYSQTPHTPKPAHPHTYTHYQTTSTNDWN